MMAKKEDSFLFISNSLIYKKSDEFILIACCLASCSKDTDLRLKQAIKTIQRKKLSVQLLFCDIVFGKHSEACLETFGEIAAAGESHLFGNLNNTVSLLK